MGYRRGCGKKTGEMSDFGWVGAERGRALACFDAERDDLRRGLELKGETHSQNHAKEREKNRTHPSHQSRAALGTWLWEQKVGDMTLSVVPEAYARSTEVSVTSSRRFLNESRKSRVRTLLMGPS